MAGATISQIKVGNTIYDIHDATVDNLETRLSTLESSVANTIKNITRSGTTFTATRTNNTTFTFTQQDNNTTTFAASAITSGTLPVDRGGTGVASRTYMNSGVWTAASGWTNEVGLGWKWNYIIGLRIQAKRSGSAISSASNGNIDDITVGTLAETFRPTTTIGWTASFGQEWCAGYIQSSGAIGLARLFPGQGFSKDRTFDTTITWLD